MLTPAAFWIFPEENTVDVLTDHETRKENSLNNGYTKSIERRASRSQRNILHGLRDHNDSDRIAILRSKRHRRFMAIMDGDRDFPCYFLGVIPFANGGTGS